MGGAEYMKSIKKYETIINEALRSALEYDTPEGQKENIYEDNYKV